MFFKCLLIPTFGSLFFQTAVFPLKGFAFYSGRQWLLFILVIPVDSIKCVSILCAGCVCVCVCVRFNLISVPIVVLELTNLRSRVACSPRHLMCGSLFIFVFKVKAWLLLLRLCLSEFWGSQQSLSIQTGLKLHLPRPLYPVLISIQQSALKRPPC